MAEKRFTKDHEWVERDGDVVTVGITEYAQSSLGDIVFVELPEIGREVATGDSIAVVESVKAASDIYAPIAGRIVEVNGAVVDDPALINRDPQGEAWFFRMEPASIGEVDALMDEIAYTALVESL